MMTLPVDTEEILRFDGTSHSDDRRQREFYKYYDPIKALSEKGPAYVDLWNPSAREKHRPQSVADRALTAFCQLAALRLQCKRALLFFFDNSNAYVLAEATKTISLQDDQVHDIADDLWLGHIIIPRGISVCEHTVTISPEKPSLGSNRDDASAGYVHIINDLRKDARFSDRPFVTDEPKARFYAGTPITTPNGVNIGAFCVLDDHPRDGLSERQINFLREMSENVMSHLEMVRSRSDYGKSACMLAGLRTFAAEASPSGPKRIPRSSARSPFTHSTPKTSPDEFAIPRARPIAARTDSSDLIERQCADISPTAVTDRFQRAAELIRNAVDFDGVLFLDASVYRFGSLVESFRPSDAPHSPNMTDSPEGEHSTDTGSGDNGSDDNLSRILGAATATGIKYQNPNEKVLKSLLRRYSRGKLWTFNNSGELYSCDELSDGLLSLTPPLPLDAEDVVKFRTNRRRNQRNDAISLRRLFPGVRNLYFLGLWDALRERWFAGAFVWTCSPMRMFSANAELNFVSLFCDSIMAEVGRIDAQIEDKAKSDFISSVSHELRSPLHGILGSVEFLQELPGADSTVLAQVETCSRTLVDIIDHVLDYSKVNHLTSQHRATRSVAESRIGDVLNSPRSHQRALTSDHQPVINLDTATEEVADTVYHSFCCHDKSDSSEMKDLDFVIDIKPSDYSSQISVGAWKRVCMNLISNALKYTKSGYIHVSLSTSQSVRKSRNGAAVLVVKDSGRGMSKDFLENHLFRAFTQEDSFVEGLGLGLSLTSKLIKEFRGTIEVHSEKGKGTTVTVTAPLMAKRANGMPLTRASTDPLELSDLAARHVHGALLQLHGHDVNSVVNKYEAQHQLQAIENTLIGIGMESFAVHQLPDCPIEQANMYFIRGDDIQSALEKSKISLPWDKPTIILCRTPKMSQKVQKAENTQKLVTRSECIAQPWGRKRLLRAINKLLNPPGLPEQIVDNAPAESEKPATLGALSKRSCPFTSNEVAPVPTTTVTSPEEGSSGALVQQEDKTNTSKGVQVPASVLSLPAQAPHPPVSPPMLATRPTTTTLSSNATTSRVPKLSLLLVDDNPINLQLLSTYASKQGHLSLTATDGLAALNSYRLAAESSRRTSHPASASRASPNSATSPSHLYEILDDKNQTVLTLPQRPQVILLDLNMPVMDGFAAARHIRAYEMETALDPPVRIVALTGLGSKAARDEALASGIDMFLTKPVRLKELTRILNDLAVSSCVASE